MTDLNRDTGGTSQRRGVHGDPWRRAGAHDVRNGDHFTAADTPLGDAEPAPARFDFEPERSGAAGCVWVAAAFVLALTLALAIALVGWLAAPRSVPDPTAAHPGASGSDVASGGAAPARALGGASGPGPTGVPPGAVSTPNPAVTRTEVLGEMVGASRETSGWASWCAPTPTKCHGWDTLFVGADRSFRYGDDPYAVQVCLADRPATCTHVVVVSHCACGDRQGIPTVIDLSPPAFRELAPQSDGIVRVIVSGPIPAPAITLPPTEAQP